MIVRAYKENDVFIVELQNDFGAVFKKKYITEEGLIEGLKSYYWLNKDFEIEASAEVFALVVNNLGKPKNKEVKKMPGRPAVGITKKYSVTLKPEDHQLLEYYLEITKTPASAFFRSLVEDFMEKNDIYNRFGDKVNN